MTSTTEKTASDAIARTVSRQPDAYTPRGLDGEQGQGLGRAAVRHAEFRTVDPQAARQFFTTAYAPGWRVTGAGGRVAITHRRCETPSLIVDEVAVQGKLALEIPAGDRIVVVRPRAGSLNVAGCAFPTIDFPILVANGIPCGLQCNAARFDVVTIGADALHRAAADRRPPLSQQTRFLSWRPRSRADVRAFHRALDYVAQSLASPDTAQQPLIVAAMTPLLAAALLECYPSNVAGRDPDGDPALPGTLKDAVSFIHRHAAGEVGINDVAAAVHLTPRAVQYLFRRQLGTTPTEYMRRLRLNRAHQELTAGSTATTTVTEIAQRWGFAHTGRFAVLYRQTYGQSPHTTLRQSMSRF
ncbi:helix-turn-helix transcriptional regulator [Mycobacterium parmense]|uniref:HTH araC/xylS-type domain-containing protein n=1 Tax=Mycobacterium parmense TaxID=185642 RepID=A0A7I7YVK9_9MYCO|nr:hypothetical protein MPRM_26180 [Mycobacterium parmense]